MSNSMVSLNFEVFGKVQGVFFRKYTREQAKKLGIHGYVKNTSQGTVVGTLEGDKANINKMKEWLKTKGSPSSRIDKAVFSEEKPIQASSYANFDIDRSSD